MQKHTQTLAAGLFVLGVGEAFTLKWLLKRKKLGQTEVKGSRITSEWLLWHTNPSSVSFSLLSASGEVELL